MFLCTWAKKNWFAILIGPNGAGKTTFFNCLTGVEPATTGTVKIGGQEVKKNTKAYKVAQMGISELSEHPPLQPVVRFGKCLDRLDQPLQGKLPDGGSPPSCLL